MHCEPIFFPLIPKGFTTRKAQNPHSSSDTTVFQPLAHLTPRTRFLIYIVKKRGKQEMPTLKELKKTVLLLVFF